MAHSQSSHMNIHQIHWSPEARAAFLANKTVDDLLSSLDFEDDLYTLSLAAELAADNGKLTSARLIRAKIRRMERLCDPGNIQHHTIPRKNICE